MSEYIRKFDTLSYSRLSTFQKCEHLYNMQYNGMINENNEIEFPERGTSQSLSYGQLTHRSIEFALMNKKEPTFEEVIVLLNADERVQMDNEAGRNIFNEEIIDYIRAVNEYVNKNNLRYVAHEYKLNVELKPEHFESDIDLSIYKKFAGDIDLVLKTPDDDVLLVDIKTAGWYYENKLKTDSFTQYQLALYKFFYSVQEDISTNNIQQAFFILKKGKKKDFFECFKFTAGDKKIKNSLEVIRKMINKASKKNAFFAQNRKSCNLCDLKNTKFCKGSNAMKMFLNNN